MEGAWRRPAHSSRCTASPRAHGKNTKILFSCFSVSKHRFSASPPSRAARLHEAPEGAHCRNTVDSGFSTLLGTKIPVNLIWFPPTCGARCRVHTAPLTPVGDQRCPRLFRPPGSPVGLQGTCLPPEERAHQPRIVVLTPSDRWMPFQREGARTQGEEDRAEAGVRGAHCVRERQPLREARTRKVWNLQRECGAAHTLMPHSSLPTERA